MWSLYRAMRIEPGDELLTIGTMNTTMLARMICLTGACLALAGCGRDSKRATAPPTGNTRHDQAGATPPASMPAARQSADLSPAAGSAGSAQTDGTANGPSVTPGSLTAATEATEGHLAERAEAAEPEDLASWMEQAARRDYAVEAAGGDARAQMLHGLSLIRKDLVIVQDRVPLLASIPVIGKKWFEKTQYFISDEADPARVAEAQAWVQRASDQHFAPAAAAERLFRQNPGVPAATAARSAP